MHKPSVRPREQHRMGDDRGRRRGSAAVRRRLFVLAIWLSLHFINFNSIVPSHRAGFQQYRMIRDYQTGNAARCSGRSYLNLTP